MTTGNREVVVDLKAVKAVVKLLRTRGPGNSIASASANGKSSGY
jgi:hypothetical protein